MRRPVPLFLAFAALAVAGSSHAQARPAAPPPTGGPGEIRGKLADSLTRRPIGSGSITIRRTRDTSFAGGGLVRDDGSFKVDGLNPGAYQVRIRTIGFAPLVRTATITPDKPLVDLGTLMLSTVAAKLDTQRVTA